MFDVRKNIGRCIWKTDEQGNPDFSIPKIDSQVATDDDRDELMAILQSGIVEKTYKSRYANNYRLFQRKIQEFSGSKDFLEGRDKNSPQVQNEYSRLPNRILNNCILLPIQASSQDAALRIFSTLNDRVSRSLIQIFSRFNCIKPSLLKGKKIILLSNGWNSKLSVKKYSPLLKFQVL